MKNQLTIGALAKQSGVSVETIRYYQRRGLLVEPPRPPNSYRTYSQQTLRRLRFIRKAQSLGFTLGEILGLLALDEKTACRQTRSAAAQKLALVEDRLRGLKRVRSALQRLILACDQTDASKPCPIIHLLDQN
jgi:MerR family mercuric resistance operon transcriptional regulator